MEAQRSPSVGRSETRVRDSRVRHSSGRSGCQEAAAVSHPHRSARKGSRGFPSRCGEARTIGRGPSPSSAVEGLSESRSWEDDQSPMLRADGRVTGSLWNPPVLTRTLSPRGLQRSQFVANSTKRDASRFQCSPTFKGNRGYPPVVGCFEISQARRSCLS